MREPLGIRYPRGTCEGIHNEMATEHYHLRLLIADKPIGYVPVRTDAYQQDVSGGIELAEPKTIKEEDRFRALPKGMGTLRVFPAGTCALVHQEITTDHFHLQLIVEDRPYGPMATTDVDPLIRYEVVERLQFEQL
jgi:hypothetical protein